MFNGSGIFSYVSNTTGINKEGEKYLVLDVLTKGTKKKVSFITKDDEVINKILSNKYVDFQDVKLHFLVDKVFNSKTRFSNWNVELVGIG